MLAMIGAFLGWKLTLLTLMVASLTGTVVGVALIAAGSGDDEVRVAVRMLSRRRRRDRGGGRPSGPRLVSGILPLMPCT